LHLQRQQLATTAYFNDTDNTISSNNTLLMQGAKQPTNSSVMYQPPASNIYPVAPRCQLVFVENALVTGTIDAKQPQATTNNHNATMHTQPPT